MDIWSIGVLLYEMIHCYPNENCNTGKLASLAQQGKEIKLKEGLSPEYTSLLKSLLKARQTERPKIREIFAHPWMVKKASERGINYSEFLEQNKHFVSMDESLSAVRVKYRTQSVLRDDRSETKTAQGALKGRHSDGNPKKVYGSATRESITLGGIKVLPHM